MVDGNSYDTHHRSFCYVIFVADILFYDLSEIVASELKSTYETKPELALSPLMRGTVMIIAAHFAIEDLVDEMAKGIRSAIEAYLEQIIYITLLLYADADDRWQCDLPHVLNPTVCSMMGFISSSSLYQRLTGKRERNIYNAKLF